MLCMSYNSNSALLFAGCRVVSDPSHPRTVLCKLALYHYCSLYPLPMDVCIIRLYYYILYKYDHALYDTACRAQLPADSMGPI